MLLIIPTTRCLLFPHCAREALEAHSGTSWVTGKGLGPPGPPGPDPWKPRRGTGQSRRRCWRAAGRAAATSVRWFTREPPGGVGSAPRDGAVSLAPLLPTLFPEPLLTEVAPRGGQDPDWNPGVLTLLRGTFGRLSPLVLEFRPMNDQCHQHGPSTLSSEASDSLDRKARNVPGTKVWGQAGTGGQQRRRLGRPPRGGCRREGRERPAGRGWRRPRGVTLPVSPSRPTARWKEPAWLAE